MHVKEIVNKGFKRYAIDGLGAMALGLFSSLIIGLILSQIAKIPGFGFIQEFAATIGPASPVVGAAIGVAVAWGLKTKPLVMFSSAATGAFGYTFMGAGPMGAFVAAVIGAEIGNLIAGRTRMDIIFVPSLTIVAGGLAGKFVGPYIAVFMVNIGAWVNAATILRPIPMGILVSTSMGMILTMPISSAAIAISLQMSGLAAGAATVGCSAQMVGFAVASYRENKLGGLIAQGLGTSMLQVPNIVRRPQIWIPATLTGALLGPISTTVFKMENIPLGAGMGTSGLVGQFGTWTAMEGTDPLMLLGLILLMHFILPAALTLLFSEGMRKMGIIRLGDMKLQL